MRDDHGKADLQQRRLRIVLVNARRTSGKTQKQVAEALEWSVPKLRRIEQGASRIGRTDLEALLTLYGITDEAERRRLNAMRLMAKHQPIFEYDDILPRSYQAFVQYESHAARIQWYEPLVVPGLLQTPAYARALSMVTGPSRVRSNDHVITRRVDFRLARQRLLQRLDPPQMHFIIDEAAVHRRVGGQSIFAEQLLHLRNMALMPHIVVQVVPFTAGEHPGLVGNFEIVDFPEPEDGSVLFIEDARRGYGTEEAPDDVADHKELFARLARIAATPEATLTLLDNAIYSVTSGS